MNIFAEKNKGKLNVNDHDTKIVKGIFGHLRGPAARASIVLRAKRGLRAFASLGRIDALPAAC